MIYAYTSCVTDGNSSTEQQILLIKRYCSDKNINIDQVYSDEKGAHKRLSHEKERAVKLGLSPYRYLYTYPALESMFVEIISESVKKEYITVLVDTRIRLYGQSEEQRTVFERIIEKYGIQVIEVGVSVCSDYPGVCIYHYTDKSMRRPLILLKQLDSMYKYAIDNGLNISGVLVDLSISCREKYEVLKEMLKKKTCEGVLVYNAYHLSRNLGQFIFIMKMADIVYSVNEGVFCITRVEEYRNKPIHAVAIHTVSDLFFEERMRYYCSNRMNWLLDSVMEINTFLNDKNDKKEKMILVEHFCDIECDVSRFIKNISNISTICSIKEGSVLIHDRKSSILC